MSDEDKLFNITRRRALGGIVAVGTAGAGVGAGTAAYFTDSAESQNNTIQSGEINLRTNGNEAPTTTINVSSVAPGESGSRSLDLSNVGTVDGFVSLDFGTPSSRNGLTELLEVTVDIEGTVVRSGTFDTVFDGEGQWSNADIPLNGGNTKTLNFSYTLPTGAGNAAAGNTAEGTFEIRLNQQEESFADVVVDSNSGAGDTSSIQAAVDAVPTNGVVLVRNGTYNEAVTVNTAGVTIASKNRSGAELVPNAQTHGNKALLIDGVDDVTVDGLRVSLQSPQPVNSEKYAVRGRPDGSGGGPSNLTVRNCLVEDITSRDVSTNDGAVRASGIVVDLEPTGGLGPATATNVTVENNTIQNIVCAGNVDQNDSRAKGIATNGDVDGANIVRNDITDIGTTTNDGSTAEAVASSGDPKGTEKPRGMTFTEDSNGDGTTNFVILDNLIQGVEGTFGQPAIFIGGTNGLGPNKVYNNEFHHPVDNLSSSGALRLRENTWVNNNAGLPQLLPAPSAGDTEVDGGNLIERDGGNNYDTTFTI